MKYLAALIVLLGFGLWYALRPAPAPQPALVHASPRPGELSQVEKEYYIQLFDYAMANSLEGAPYPWQSSDINRGEIIAGKAFTSKSSATCRPFTERFTVGGYSGAFEGIACRREGAEGWCRLKTGDALTCALERPADIANFQFPGMSYGGANVSVNVPAGGSGVGQVGAPSAPASPAPFDAPQGGNKKPGEGYADTVTGTAGRVAGPATGGAINWFNETFR
jgi:hypothetical protein